MNVNANISYIDSKYTTGIALRSDSIAYICETKTSADWSLYRAKNDFISFYVVSLSRCSVLPPPPPPPFFISRSLARTLFLYFALAIRMIAPHEL